MKYVLSSLLVLSFFGSYNSVEAQSIAPQYIEKKCGLWQKVCIDIVSHVKAGTMSEVQQYVEAGNSLYVNYDKKNFTLLHASAWYGYLEMSKYLAYAGMQQMGPQFLEIKNSTGKTALHNAAIRNNRTVAKFLLESGSFANAQDYSGNTAAHYAAKDKNLEMVKMLINIGQASLDIKNTRGTTARQIMEGITVDDAF